ncbi:MAG: hypothetical protein WAN65_00620, partial [Candidatus Sulfotelmatobacter sp.]
RALEMLSAENSIPSIQAIRDTLRKTTELDSAAARSKTHSFDGAAQALLKTIFLRRLARDVDFDGQSTPTNPLQFSRPHRRGGSDHASS